MGVGVKCQGNVWEGVKSTMGNEGECKGNVLEWV